MQAVASTARATVTSIVLSLVLGVSVLVTAGPTAALPGNLSSPASADRSPGARAGTSPRATRPTRPTRPTKPTKPSAPLLRADETRLQVGERTVLRATAPRRRRAVLQWSLDQSQWHRFRLQVRAGRTVRVPIKPSPGAQYFRLITRRDGVVKRSSEVVRVAVALDTAVALWSSPPAVPSGGLLTLRGEVEPGTEGLPVHLERRVDGRGWVVEARGRSDRRGSFRVEAAAPAVTETVTARYRIRVPRWAVWNSSSTGAFEVVVAAATALRVDGPPVAFEVGPAVGAHVDIPVSLEADEPVTVELSSVVPDRRSLVGTTLLDPDGVPVEREAFGDTYYGLSARPEASGTYTVRLTAETEPHLVSGVVWVSSPLLVPIEVDGPPVEIDALHRPGQARWLTLERGEGELLSVGCLTIGFDDCASSHQLVSVGFSPVEIGTVGPVGDSLWNPPRTGSYYFSDPVPAAHQVWLTSAGAVPTRLIDVAQTLTFDRPGQARVLSVEVTEGTRYAISAIDRGLVDPSGRKPDFEVAGFGPGSTYFSMRPTRGSALTTFRAAATGALTIFVDPVAGALGPIQLDFEPVEERR